MKECIERDAAIEAMDEDIKNYRGFMAEEQFTHEDAKEVLAKVPTADVVEVVRCKDCIYWQKPQIKLHDGTYRDYEPGEYENGSILGGVELSVGINVGSFCAKYDKWHGNKIPQFMGENDFCSKGETRAECTK